MRGPHDRTLLLEPKISRTCNKPPKEPDMIIVRDAVAIGSLHPNIGGEKGRERAHVNQYSMNEEECLLWRSLKLTPASLVRIFRIDCPWNFSSVSGSPCSKHSSTPYSLCENETVGKYSSVWREIRDLSPNECLIAALYYLTYEVFE